ncbi:hypothetical protein GCM10009630_72090 [Kribbella jejuensis]|uniref:Putative ArsR family transcriptional regulator n=1 Tax=Kribbella jejuensis TaxID=236068 RepID=A0A542DB08_9ACTN|nr:helix-turn-helix domain-containing protein [Kribbella jejuensis]TQJ00258.1 putative ArsR family transcriptional regulator [Kribbella jejuensis]
MDSSWDASLQAVAVLEEPTRRRLYEYVAGRAEPVSRDDAAAALGIPRTTAAFHLDRLTDEGLLDTCYERRTGRTGPGAGRPAKLYHRSDREIEITLPERQYAVAGHLLAAAIQDAETGPLTPREAINHRATEYGQTLAHIALTKAKPTPTPTAAPTETATTAAPAEKQTADRPNQTDATRGPAKTDAARGAGGMGAAARQRAGGRELLVRVLEAHGFEPRAEGDGIALGNCPFRRLAKEHPQLVCGMNLHLVTGLLTGLDVALHAELAPSPGHCCVRISGRAPLTNTADDAPATAG